MATETKDDEPSDEPSGADLARLAHEQAGVKIPTESAMSRKIQEIINKFRIRKEGSRDFTTEEEENVRLDHEIKKFLVQKQHAYAKKHRYPDRGHYERGRTGKQVWKPQFEFFHIVNDDALEVATMRMVETYDKLHDNKREWGKERMHVVEEYLARVRQLRKSERKRLTGFQSAEFSDLHMTRAYSGLPLYQILQMGSEGGGPYGFARDVSSMYDPGKRGKDEWSEAQLKGFAKNNGLTADDMARIVVQTGHSIRDPEGLSLYLHGQEKDMFGTKYTMKQFAEHFSYEIQNNNHVENVLRKIRLESKPAYSSRGSKYVVPVIPPYVAEAEAEEGAKPEPIRKKRKRNLDMDDNEPISIRPPPKKGRPGDAPRPKPVRRSLMEGSVRNAQSSLESITSLSTINDEYQIENDQNAATGVWKGLFPEIYGRNVKMGRKQLQLMSEHAAHLGHSTYDSAFGSKKNWSPDRRFRLPSGFAGKTDDEMPYHEHTGNNPFVPRAHTYLGHNPMYQQVMEQMNGIAHAFNASDIAHAHTQIPQKEYLHDFNRDDFTKKKLSDAFMGSGKNPHFYSMMKRRNHERLKNVNTKYGQEDDAYAQQQAEKAYFGEIEDAYATLHQQQERAKGKSRNYLSHLRSKYSNLLEKVRDLDHGRTEKLSSLLLTKDIHKRELPNISGLEFPIKWDNYDAKSQKKLRKQFAPDQSHMDHMISGGWTQDRFLKMMLQIPEMQLYLDTNGYRDFSKYGDPEFNIRRGGRAPSAERLSMSPERLMLEMPEPSPPMIDLTESVESDRRTGSRGRALASKSRSSSPRDSRFATAPLPTMAEEDEKKEPTRDPFIAHLRQQLDKNIRKVFPNGDEDLLQHYVGEWSRGGDQKAQYRKITHELKRKLVDRNAIIQQKIEDVLSQKYSDKSKFDHRVVAELRAEGLKLYLSRDRQEDEDLENYASTKMSDIEYFLDLEYDDLLQHYPDSPSPSPERSPPPATPPRRSPRLAGAEPAAPAGAEPAFLNLLYRSQAM